MGVFIGVVVLLVCIGFVVLMMVTEWSSTPAAQPLAEKAAAAPSRRSAGKPAKASPKKKAAPKKKSAPKKKK